MVQFLLVFCSLCLTTSTPPLISLSYTHSRSMVMEWWPFEDEGLVGSGSIGCLSYQRGPVAARRIQSQALILICAIATVLCVCNGGSLNTCIRRDVHIFYAELAAFLLLSVSMYSVISQIVFHNVCKMLHATTLCSSALTVIHCGLPQGHWGWVSTQSELYIKPIGLIYSPNNSWLIKKRKGIGGI